MDLVNKILLGTAHVIGISYVFFYLPAVEAISAFYGPIGVIVYVCGPLYWMWRRDLSDKEKARQTRDSQPPSGPTNLQ